MRSRLVEGHARALESDRPRHRVLSEEGPLMNERSKVDVGNEEQAKRPLGGRVGQGDGVESRAERAESG